MDYILAAHIRVTGGEAAVAELRKVDQAMAQVGKSTSSQTGQGITAGLKAATDQASGLSQAMGKVGDAAIRMGTYMGLHMLVDGFRQAAGGVLDFDQAMTESLAIQSGVTGRMRGQMEDLAKSIAVDLGMAPKEAAEGFYYLASAGLNVQQQMAALPQVAAFAKAGMMDLEKATELSYDALSALGQKVSDPQQQLRNLTNLTDELTVAAIESQGTVEQFGEAIANKAGASMKTFGIPMEEGIGLLEVFADQGIKGKVAGERFSMVIRDLALKSLTHADAWKKLGIEVYNSQGGFNSLLGIITQLDHVLGGMNIEARTQALKELGFTQRDVQTVLALIGTSDAMRNFTEDLKSAGGAAQEVADKQMESLRSKIDQFKSVSIVLAIDGWEKLQEVGAWLGHTFAPAIDAVWQALGKIGPGLKPMADVLGGMIVGGGAAALQGVAKALDAVFSTIASHQGLAEGLGAGLAGMIVLPQLGRFVDYLGGPLLRVIGDAKFAWDGFVQNFRAANFSTSSGALDAVAGAFRGVGSALATLAVPAGFAAVGVGIYGLISDFQKGEKAAKDFYKTLEASHPTNTPHGIEDQLSAAQAKFQENEKWMSDNAGSWFEGFKRRGMSALDSITPGFLDYEHNVIELAGVQKKAGEENEKLEKGWINQKVGLSILGQAFSGVRPDIAALGTAIKGTVLDMDVGAVGAFANRLEHMSTTAGIAQVPIETMKLTMFDLANQMKIDTKMPWTEWVPQLADAYVALQRARDAAGELGGAMAQGIGGKATGLEQALFTLMDQAANTEDRLKSLQTVMLGMDKGGTDVLTGTANFAQALSDLGEALTANKAAGKDFFDPWNEAGRNAIDKLVGAREEAINLATAMGGTEGVTAGAAHLQGYADSIAEVMRQAGVGEDVIASYLAQLGLTPEQITTLIKTTMEGKDPKDAKSDLDALDGSTAGAEFMINSNLTEINARLKEITNPTSTDITFRTPGIEEVIGGVTEVAKPRTQETTVETPNRAAKDEELNETARQREQPTEVTLPNAEWARGVLNGVAAQRTALIVAEAATGVAEAAIRALTGFKGTAYVDVVTRYSQVQVPGQGIAAAAEGGIMSFAPGGFNERHIAQIAPAGAWRLWAEPETGGEAYIPLAGSKRDRSMAIWEEVGRRFGVQGGGGQQVNIHAPVSVTATGNAGQDPAAFAAQVASQTQAAVNQVMTRALVELRAR